MPHCVRLKTTMIKSISSSLPKASTHSTPTTTVEAVEGVECVFRKPKYCWQMERGLDRNFHQLGKLLASLELELFRTRESGMLFVDDNKVHHINSAKDLAPLLIDNVRIAVTKNGKYTGEKPSDSILGNMLRSRSFLDNFRLVDDVTTTPVVLPVMMPSQPGYNCEGQVLYLGAARGRFRSRGVEINFPINKASEFGR